jgi:hypothetical protein
VRLRFLVFCVLVAALLAACSTPGRTRTDTKMIELGAADSVSVTLQMRVGELDVTGGADSLMNAQFVYNLPEWEPEVDYRIEGTEGVLTVVQPSIPSGLPVGDVRYQWDVRFNDDVPMALSVDLGAGQGDLTLANLSLSELQLKAGVGEARIDLSGTWDHDVRATMQGGVGELTVRLPGQMGALVRVSGGLGAVNAIGLSQEDGAYVNDAYGRTESTLTLEINGGVGEVTLEVVD